MPGTLQIYNSEQTAQIPTLMEFASWWVQIDNKIGKTECEVAEVWEREPEQERGTEISEAWRLQF